MTCSSTLCNGKYTQNPISVLVPCSSLQEVEGLGRYTSRDTENAFFEALFPMFEEFSI